MTRISISTGAARILFQYMAIPTLHAGVVNPYNAAKLLTKHLHGVAKVPAELVDAEGKPILPGFEEWLEKPYPEFEISESMRDTVKAAFEKLATQEGAINPDKFYVELAPLFGLVPAE